MYGPRTVFVSVVLRLEGTSAAARLDGIGIVKREPALVETFVEVEFGPIQVQFALAVDHDIDAVLSRLCILDFVELLVETESVRESATAAAGHAYSQKRSLFIFLLRENPLHFFCGSFGQLNRHCSHSPKSVGPRTAVAVARWKVITLYESASAGKLICPNSAFSRGFCPQETVFHDLDLTLFSHHGSGRGEDSRWHEPRNNKARHTAKSVESL